MNEKRKTQVLNITFIFIFLCAVVFLIWKARYSIGGFDECFYLTVPKRFLQGDAPLIEEWHVSQLSSLLLVPIMKIYLIFNPTEVGMILHFRLIYIFFHSLCTLIIYRRLKNHSRPGSFFGSLLFLIYAPFGISALSYNSMGIDLFALSIVLAATSPHFEKASQSILYNAMIGLLFSGAVLCQPYLAALYFIYALIVLGLIIYKKHRRSNSDTLDEILSPKALSEISFGVAAAVVVFAIYILSRTSISQIIDAVPMILSDPEHPTFSLLKAIESFIDNVLTDRLTIFCYALTAILSVLAIFDRKSELRRDIYFATAAAATFMYACNFSHAKFPNFLMISLNLLGIVSFSLLKKRPYRLFFIVFVPTVYYSFVMNITSNQKFHVISSVFSVASIVSAVFITMFLHETHHSNVSVRSSFFRTVCATFSSCFLLSLLIFVRGNCNFAESMSTHLLTAKIETGINAGIRTRSHVADTFFKIMEDTAELRSVQNGKVLYFASETYLYLTDSKESASFSAWLSLDNHGNNEIQTEHIENELNRLSRYYELNPDKRPDYIYINIKTDGTVENVLRILQIKNYELQTTKYGNTLITVHQVE